MHHVNVPSGDIAEAATARARKQRQQQEPAKRIYPTEKTDKKRKMGKHIHAYRRRGELRLYRRKRQHHIKFNTDVILSLI